MRIRSIFVLAALLIASGTLAQDRKAGTITTEKKAFTTSGGKTYEYDLGTLYVPENRSDPKSRVIGVGFAHFRSSTSTAGTPPMFLLPGGPGSSFVSAIQDIPNAMDVLGQDLSFYLQVCDVVFVDQRGYSRWGEEIMGMFTVPARPTDRALRDSDFMETMVAFAHQVVDESKTKGIDLRGYTVKECASDVADLRKALGFEKIVLNGTSFGSQWAFAIMKMYPEIVARALLSGVEPLDSGYDMPSYLFAAAQRMWHHIEQDERFKPYLPKGGMAEAAQKVMEKLERGEFVVKAKDDDRTLATYGPFDFPWNNPTRILELYHGHLGGWVAQAEAGFRGGARPLPAIGGLIDSSLATTPQRMLRLMSDPAARFVPRTFMPFIASADIWPTEDVGDDFRTPELCDIPVLFLQGDWDTSTPLENTFEIAPYFPNSRVVIGERGGHGIIRPLYREHPDVWKEVMQFLSKGDFEGLPARVALAPSRQFAPPTFPPPSVR